jgi:hypothetical protein
MTSKIVGKALTNVDLASDGSCVRFNLTDVNDRSAALELPIECINQMLMTLPHVINRALRSLHRDDSFRLVFPLGAWRLERVAGDERLILSLATDDGFEVSFVISTVEIARMQETVSAAAIAPLALN